MSTIDDYEFRTFPAGFSDGTPDAATTGWLQSETQGFHGKRLTPEFLSTVAGYLVSDKQALTGVYSPARAAGSLSFDPVATFSSFERSLTVSPGRQLPAHLISGVTVRPTHRRRGILRRMMVDDLTRAAADGFAIAALTASEATIYRRFGFGAATWAHSIQVSTDSRFRLLREPSGSCEVVDARDLSALAPGIFAGFHATRTGSVDRHSQYWDRITGMHTQEGEEDRSMRAAVHYDERGVIDGYVSYRFLGWDSEPHQMSVADLVATNDDAYLGLWQYLASIDLIEKVSYSVGLPDDPLRWALSNPRLIAVKDIEDWVWLRILDPIAAFEARSYSADGSIVIRVSDELGFAAGTFRLDASGGSAGVTRVSDGEADVAVDAWVLGSIYLGGVDPATLMSAGQLEELTAGAVERLRALLVPEGPVYGNTHF